MCIRFGYGGGVKGICICMYVGSANDSEKVLFYIEYRLTLFICIFYKCTLLLLADVWENDSLEL